MARKKAQPTLATRYNALARKLMPGQDRLLVDPSINISWQIDDEVFRRSEYLGGMAGVILALLKQEGAEAAPRG
ncbi:MAG: hypothetical protein Q4G22_14625 [Paracoccus sp. (in: a-proteobacteria)]|uniref:hypothetical protein n=1 Tax=Paracoccus sp. TaxID=267 RepID=UPI0026DEB02C|nr:hypothetical protein [Paracoccus sp. (in: a-proteobacteria)]MDO5633048.1 hypothetical protein [Paracoccus sp. (in: a-proteobacteria)]